MRVVGVPLGLHLAGPLGVGEQADRRAEDVGEAVQLALGQVEATTNQRRGLWSHDHLPCSHWLPVQRLVRLQELHKLTRGRDSSGRGLVADADFNLIKRLCTIEYITLVLSIVHLTWSGKV